jgi:hypothetical protein
MMSLFAPPVLRNSRYGRRTMKEERNDA